MIRRTLIASTVLSILSIPALAQNSVTVVREAVPTQSQPIVANSPQDLALQEEIRKIRAYNAQVDSQVGISDAYIAPTANTATTIPAVTNSYQGGRVELFAAPSTTISYNSAPMQPVTASTTEHIPATNYTRVHRVIENDTLYNLARRNCVSVVDIQNQNDMSDNNIRIGQLITLPASQCGAEPALAATTPVVTRSATGNVRQVLPIQTGIKVREGDAYAVLPKDSLYSIGRRYCLKADELAGFNGIDIETPIQPGQILRLPSTACNK